MSDAVIVVVTAGLSKPSSTRLLGERLAAAATSSLETDGVSAEVRIVELREIAVDLTHHLLTGVPSARVSEVIDALLAADGVIAITPVFNASYSGLFKMFFDVLDEGALRGKPLLMGATGGTARHSLAVDQAMLPLFFYLKATLVPTSVFAATQDWGDTSALASRIEQAGRELASLMQLRPAAPSVDPFTDVVDFERLLHG